MRHLTLDYIEKLVMLQPKLLPDRRPEPMPSRKWPTRVAWKINLADLIQMPSGHWHYKNYRSFSYIGKPNRYRAIEARRLLAVRKPTALLSAWQAEFDKAGLVAYLHYAKGEPHHYASGAFTAYHPHSAQAEVIEAFTRPLYLKYIGGMRIYSQKRKLTSDQVEAYYAWYQQQFKRRLRRPKAHPTAIIAGQVEETGAPPPETGSIIDPITGI